MVAITSNVSAPIFDIQRYAIHDGPGIRTLVFLKGCPLKCWWCCNPESQLKRPQLALFPQNCITCGKCIENCPENAISDQEGLIITEKNKCIECGSCTVKCYANARKIIGRQMNTEEVFDEILKDELFYKNSGGGVTLSGGEPLLWLDFVASLLQKCKAGGIHTAVETSGYARWSNFERLQLQHLVDLFLYDLKIMDEHQHKKYTGVSNKIILDNLSKLNECGASIIIRVPIISKINDLGDQISSLISYIKGLKNVKEVHLLPYHRMGESKYNALSRTYPLKEITTIDSSKQEAENIRKLMLKQGIECKVIYH